MLNRAIMKGDEVKVTQIIKSGKFNKQDRTLIYAVRANQYSVVKLLIDKGMDVNVKDVYGKTALSWALELEQKAMALLLINAGATLQQGREQIWWGH